MAKYYFDSLNQAELMQTLSGDLQKYATRIGAVTNATRLKGGKAELVRAIMALRARNGVAPDPYGDRDDPVLRDAGKEQANATAQYLYDLAKAKDIKKLYEIARTLNRRAALGDAECATAGTTLAEQ